MSSSPSLRACAPCQKCPQSAIHSAPVMSLSLSRGLLAHCCALKADMWRARMGGPNPEAKQRGGLQCRACWSRLDRPSSLSLRLCVFSVPPLSRLDFSSLSLSESVSSRHDFNFAPHCAKVSRIACSRDAIEISERKEGLGTRTRSQAGGSYIVER